MLDYIWTKENRYDEVIFKMSHTSSIEISATKFEDFRVWDVDNLETVGVFSTLKEAKKASETYHQINQ